MQLMKGDETMEKYKIIDAHCHIYPDKIAEKAEKKAEKDKAKAEKTAKDKAKREAAKAKKEAAENAE